MGRNEKRKSSESELDGRNVDEMRAVFKPGFFVPCHPLLIAGNTYVHLWTIVPPNPKQILASINNISFINGFKFNFSDCVWTVPDHCICLLPKYLSS